MALGCGGKHYLADWVIERLPPHCHFVEPYFGGGAVLLNKDPLGVSEVCNDINARLINFWRVLADENLYQKMVRILQATPCSEERYQRAEQASANRTTQPDSDILSVDAAVDFFVMCRQSRAATFKGFTNLAKTRTRGGMNELPNAWWRAIEGMPSVYERLKRVVILNRPAVEVIRTQDGKDTLVYADPPYVHETRTTTDSYEHEMSLEQHEELLDVLCGMKGKFALSGYDNALYRKHLGQFEKHERKIVNQAAGGKKKRVMVECLWIKR